MPSFQLGIWNNQDGQEPHLAAFPQHQNQVAIDTDHRTDATQSFPLGDIRKYHHWQKVNVTPQLILDTLLTICRSPGYTLIDSLSCDRNLEAEIASGRFKQRRWTGEAFERRRYSDVDEATIRTSVAMLSIQSMSKCPKASHEAPAVLSSKRESRKPGLTHREPNVERTAKGNLPHYTAFGDSLDDPFHYCPGNPDDDEYRFLSQWDSGFSDFGKQFHSSSIPSTPSLTHGQSIATPSNVCSLRLDNAENHFPSKLLTVENISKLPGLPKKKRRHLSSCTSSLGGHSATTKTSIVYHKGANPKADPDIQVSERHKRPKIKAIPATVDGMKDGAWPRRASSPVRLGGRWWSNLQKALFSVQR
jgi:hypothetical protein